MSGPIVISPALISHARSYLKGRLDAGVTCRHELRRLLHRYFNWEVSSPTCRAIVHDFLMRNPYGANV